MNAAVIVPHTNWREEFSGGTYLQGSPSTAPVSWPGYSTTAWYQGQPPQEQNRVYMGTVLEGQRDASGQMYKRNRFYDPQTGQFTQTDPIGIAGGLNTYGFAAGDPVSYSDPYGLKVCFRGSTADVDRLRDATARATGAAIHLDARNCISSVGPSENAALAGLRNRLERLVVDDSVFSVAMSGVPTSCENWPESPLLPS